MINYLIEYKENDFDDIGFENDDQYLTVNCSGYYINDECNSGREMIKTIPKGRNDYLFCYIVRGSVIYDIGGQKMTVSNGFVIIPPHVPYAYRHVPINCEFEIYWVHFSGYHADECLNECGLKEDYYFHTDRIDEVVLSVQNLTREMTFKMPGYEHVAQSLLTYILVVSSRRYTSSVHSSKNIDLRMRNVMEHIYHNYSDELTISDLSEFVELSVSHFSNLFKQTFGLYPLQYITNYRLKRACDLLRHTQHPVSKVAEMTGFKDPLYFSRVFRKQLSISPSDYRKKVTNELFVDSPSKYMSGGSV